MTTFQFKKKFGQNFLQDGEILNKIADISGVSKDDLVIEIGAGKGALTEVLAKRAKQVFAFEIDPDLKDFLSQKFKDTNVSLIFDDVMKYSEKDINSLTGGKFKLVANLPYYITSPIITKFLEFRNLESMTIMVQEEVADRIVAKNKSKEYGVLTLICQAYGTASKVMKVPKEKFYPVPKVDSAVVKIEKDHKVITDVKPFIGFVKKAFSMRRKKLSACLANSSCSKEELEQILCSLGLNPLVRAEELDFDTLFSLYNVICDKN